MWTILLLLAGLFGNFGMAAKDVADAPLVQSAGVFCDTLGGAHDFMANWKGGDSDPLPAIEAANARSKVSGDCGTAVLYIKKLEPYDAVKGADGGTWRFSRIQIIAQIEFHESIKYIRPMREGSFGYTAFLEPAEPKVAACDTSKKNCI